MEAATPKKLSIDEARREVAGGEAQAIDIRSRDDWVENHVPGAIHVPGGDPEAAAEGLESGWRLLVIGDDDADAEAAAASLGDRGFEAAVVEGGMKAWKSEGYTVQPSDDPDPDAGGESEAEVPEDAV
jgi:rhodanese-related sulfurtransferase